MSHLIVKAVQDKAGMNDFLAVPFDVFRNDRNWVPPLYFERHEHLSSKKNPYFKHAEAQLFVAYRDGRPVGRISAQIDRLHLERYNDATGQFGFLDIVDDPAVFTALFNVAEDWLRARHILRVRGPFSFSINDESGLLIDGFDRPPNMMMGHGRPYFASRVEEQGYQKVKDLIAYEFDGKSDRAYLLERTAKRARERHNIQVRTINKKNLEAELQMIMTIFNDAWSDNWGFVPLTNDEIKVLGNNLKMLISDGYVSIAMINGEAAAMAVTLPNINEWIHDLKGRLLPFGWAKLIYRVVRSKHTSVRLPLMGVLKKYQNRPMGSMLAVSVIEGVRAYHYSQGTYRGELSWILEDNKGMRSIIEAAGAQPYKTYRVYEKNLG
jgi:hypothetical protein